MVMLITNGMKMEEIFKPKPLFAMQWNMYRLYCHKNGLAEGSYKNFKKWVEGK